MSDVFDSIPLTKHTGQGRMTVDELRAKYGPGLTFTADPAKRQIIRGWERSQVQVLTLHFQTAEGTPVSGIEGAYFWPDSPPAGVRVASNDQGNIDWPFSGGSFYDPPAEVGPYTFKGEGLTITGMGSPSKNHPYNHDSMSWDVVVNPSSPAPPPGGGDEDTVDTALIETQLKVIDRAVATIRAAIA